jgi:purine catabolism regulator
VAGVRVVDILNLPGLALRLVAGEGGRDNAIRWVHVSELEDPTPWLKGGELLLTTGMGLEKSPAGQRAYIQRLAEAGLAGLGFGIGFTYTKVPKALTDAAARAGFPVFEVPYPVPFIAITEAVYSRLAADQVEVMRRSLEAQTALTGTLLAGDGVAGLAAELSRALRGWVVVFDVHGQTLAATPPSAKGRVSRVWKEVRRSRRDGTGFSLTLADRGDHVAVHPVGARGHVEGYLAVGTEAGFSQLDRIVVGHGLSLLAIELDKSRAVAEAEHRLGGDFLDALIGGDLAPAEAARGLERFGFSHPDRLAVMAVESEVAMEELQWAADGALSAGHGAFLTAPRDGTLYVVARIEGDGTLPELHRDIAVRVKADVVAGAGTVVMPEEVGRSLREARYAMEVCRVERRAFADFRSLGTFRLLLTMQEPDALRAFADSVLAPLDEYDDAHQGGLRASLRAFLTHNARWEAAAAELFVHRHTLRYRMRKVEELTGRDLGSAHDRVEFWLALRARDLQDASGEKAGLDRSYSRRRGVDTFRRVPDREA